MKIKKVLSIPLVMLGLVLASCTATPTLTPLPTPLPTLKILSPEEGATLPAGDVTITIEVTDFHIVSQLGQPNIAGEGHIHYYLDAEPPTTPGQPAVTGPGTYAATAELSQTWQIDESGTHTIGAQLVNNDHTPLEPPVVATVTVNVSATTTATTTPPLRIIPGGSIQVERVFPNLSFHEMTNLVQPDDTSGLIFVTEQRGVIHAFTTSQPQQGSYVFLDITDRVNRGGNEEGLLGLAFDSDYRENGHFYVYYSATNPRRSVVSRFSIDQGNPGVAAPQSEVVIMEVEQPFVNHNGGQIAFGTDGYLYIGIGDGGGAGDPQHNGQDLGTLLGSILRIDVSRLLESGDYEIPIDNPFVDTAGARGEIWAFGLRNPWRFSFDTETGLLWAGDVGQSMWEEIDIITKGANYGWNIMEGFHCYSPATGCDQSGLTLPLVEYEHSQGCSVTGGYLYRGDSIPYLQGYYIYGDYCSGNIWALGYDGNVITDNILLAESGLSITSFGEDLAGNLYILSREGGIYTLVQME